MCYGYTLVDGLLPITPRRNPAVENQAVDRIVSARRYFF